ncbi:MAG TPA: metalloregulator ArsR/SmtB family transcription factor [Gemmataceae bacterium]|nr:metalloregulator ArsR/SmtB family transcription factor [Gemmataceae bacterium]
MNPITVPTPKPRGPRLPTFPVPAQAPTRSLRELTQIFKLLADESRLRLVLALADEGEMNVSTLCGMLHTKQPAVSHHLKLLHLSGLVEFRRDGKHNYYRLESDLVAGLLQYLASEAAHGSRPAPSEEFALPRRRK